ncbi:MAG: hypothetical protein WBX01_05590 [Nitrososphaeraceae archaeon]
MNTISDISTSAGLVGDSPLVFHEKAPEAIPASSNKYSGKSIPETSSAEEESKSNNHTKK